MKKRLIFITATDTGVGKTIATAVLGTLLQARGMKVGVCKPVQCAGDDALFLKKTLKLTDSLSLINPIFVSEPLSPHLALRRAGIKFDLNTVKLAVGELSKRYDVILVEGAGGLMVPLKDNYYVADLIRDLKAQVIIVSRLGLGTINHALLTINQAKAKKLSIKGLLFSDTNPGRKSLPEQTNPNEITKLIKGTVPFIGTVPFLKSLTRANILKTCQHLKLDI